MNNLVGHSKALKNLSIVVSIFALMACGNDKPVKAGQALVKVNKEEITVHQLNTELKYVGTQPAGVGAEQVQRQILESLVDRQLLVEEAIKNKLDRDAETLQILEREKAQVLAQAYLQRKLNSLSRPTEEEISSYFREHPELFVQRKLFELKHVMLTTDDFTPDVKALVDSAKSIEDIAAWLDAKKIKHIKEQSNRSTTDLPPNLIGQLDELAKGAPFIMKDASNVLIASLKVIKNIPVGEQAARQEIEKFLVNRRAQREAADEVARLRKSANIIFHNHPEGTPSSPVNVAEPQRSNRPESEAKSNEADIKKGLAGLR